jgi:hypothetical protein
MVFGKGVILTFYNKSLNNKRMIMEIMRNYLEYYELLESWSHADLQRAWDAVHCSKLQEELYEEESILLAFLIDTELQEKLHLYFEDIERDRNRSKIYDW